VVKNDNVAANANAAGGALCDPPGGDLQINWSVRTSSQDPIMRGFQSENCTSVTFRSGVETILRRDSLATDNQLLSDTTMKQAVTNQVSPQPILTRSQGGGAHISLVTKQEGSPVNTTKSPVVTLNALESL
jgi:hypothetical protein